MNTPPDPAPPQPYAAATSSGVPTPPIAPPPAPAPSAQQPKRRGWVVALVVVLVVGTLAACCAVPVLIGLSGRGAADLYSNGIAVIHVNGVIAGTSSSGGLAGGQVTPEYLVDLIRAADDDPGIEAILLRIDSPGGTAAASQEIAMEIARVNKPIIASVGDVAASGAYWIASQCDAIVATPSSAVGSIGVILQIPNYEGLLDKIGVEYTVITRGEFKDAGSPFRSLTATEVAMLNTDMDFIYEQFVQGVAEGRGLEVAEVEEMATGWVWSAGQAIDMGLVDELGTYQDAIDIAADQAGIDTFEVIYYDEPSPWDLLYWFVSATDQLGRIGEVRLDGLESPPLAR